MHLAAGSPELVEGQAESARGAWRRASSPQAEATLR